MAQAANVPCTVPVVLLELTTSLTDTRASGRESAARTHQTTIGFRCKMLIIALDPGITTGYVIARIDDSNKLYVSCGEAVLNHRQFWDLLLDVKPTHIICESFEYRSRARDNLELYSREIIGITKLYTSFDGTKLHMQTAAQGKGFFTDDQLRRMGLYEKGKKHGRDALRHFLHWFTFQAGYQYNTQQKILLTSEGSFRNGS